MIDDDIINRIRYAKAKLRNIPYYWEYDESLGESRSRKQYMHVLRSFRKQLEFLCTSMENMDKEYFKNDIDVFKEIINLIPPKVKTEECGDIIQKLKSYVK